MPEDVDSNEAEVSDGMSENEHDYDDDMDSHIKDEHNDGAGDGSEAKRKYDPKDPTRPRRKKARRACFACQRAHLTCGDERPCQRCIKRGLADACQDGVRKKAKYLHDAPPEALRPVLGPNYNPTPNASQNPNQNPAPTRPNGHRNPSSAGSEASAATFFSQSNPSTSYSVFPQTSVATYQDGLPYVTQQSPVSPTFQAPNSSQLGITVPQVSQALSSFSPIFDPSNPALYNFNIDGLNFGSQYGAMEFGMLGHMSSGAAETPPRDSSISQQGAGDINYGPGGVFGNGVSQVYDSGMMGGLLGLDQSANGLYAQGNLQHGLPHAFAIAAGPSSLQSPSTENNSPQPTNFGFDSSPTPGNYSTSPSSGTQAIAPTPRSKPKTSAAPRLGPQTILGKRQRDPSYIYETVKEPYLYVNGFHKLIAILKERFSSTKILRIAKSLASIRPSFISCTRTLNRDDLVFMEKSFQRTLFEYEDFMLQCSAPTIVCRRTGEVAAVNKEFTALTGWTKEVLLGKEPNLNVNTGGGPGSASTTGRAGLTTPKIKALNVESGSTKTADADLRPIFIAELMDDDSVIDFYEDYAQLAFEDSRGHVTRKCRLLKYRTQQNLDGGGGVTTDGGSGGAEEVPQKDPRSSILSSRVTRIDGEHGISRIAKDGKLECSYCWTIKRDTFDIPMMIVMNFLPCYYPNQEPHQLAV